MVSEDGADHMLYFYMSPYKRSLQTYEAVASQFSPDHIQGCQEEVQLREQDFGNFQVWSALHTGMSLQNAMRYWCLVGSHEES